MQNVVTQTERKELKSRNLFLGPEHVLKSYNEVKFFCSR